MLTREEPIVPRAFLFSIETPILVGADHDLHSFS